MVEKLKWKTEKRKIKELKLFEGNPRKMSVCEFCKKRFYPKRNYEKYQAKFCSEKCFGLWQSINRRGNNAAHWKGGKIKKNCLMCDKEFYITFANKNKSKFCSNKCYWNFLKTLHKPISEKTKIKIGLANSRKIKYKCSYCEKELLICPSDIKNHKRHFCSKICYGKFLSRLPKEKTSNWQGGINSLHDTIRKSEKNKIWKQKILKRDNYKCQICYKKGKDLVVHHIKRFSILIKEAIKEFPLLDKFGACIIYLPLWNLDNGITLCKGCHYEIHYKK